MSLKLLSVLVLGFGIGGGIWLARATDNFETKSYNTPESAIASAAPQAEVLPASGQARASGSPQAVELSAQEPSPSTQVTKSQAAETQSVESQSVESKAVETQSNAVSLSAKSAKSAQPVSERGDLSPKRGQSSTKSTLAEEQKLIAAAQIAIRKKQFSKALVILKSHSSKFPSGILTPERKAATAIALCSSGKRGKPSARRFLESHSQSPLAARVRASCELH